MVFCPRLKILVFIKTDLIFKILNVSLKFKLFEIWNLDKCSYCPEWTFYGNFFYIDLKYSFEFISSLFEDFLTTSRYWSFSNKTQLNWALKWFISNRIFLDLSLLFRIYSWYCRFNLMLSTSVVIYLAYKIKQLRSWMKLNKNIDTKVNTVLQCGGWFLSNTESSSAKCCVSCTWERWR